MKLTWLFTLLFVVSVSHSQALLKFSVNGNYGYMNSKGEIRINPSFSNAQEFSEGLAFVYRDKKIGLINESGHMIIDYKFDFAFPFQDSVAIVQIDSLYGLIDVQGNFIIPPDFQRLYFQNDGIIGVQKNNLWGFYSTSNGQAITDIKYSFIGRFNEGMAMVKDVISGKYGFINKNGHVAIPCSLTMVYSAFNNGFAAVSDSLHRNCYINRTGKNVFNAYYYSVSGFSEGFAFVKQKADSGYFIDQKGERVSSSYFKNAWYFSEGYCSVETDSSYAVIDMEHQVVFESKNIELRFFANGFGFFCYHSDSPIINWGLMDTNMNLISRLSFVQVFSIPNKDYVEFYLGDPTKWYGHSKRGYMDIKGHIIWKEE